MASTRARSAGVTLNLPPGRYELACNLPWHYADDMYTELRVWAMADALEHKR